MRARPPKYFFLEPPLQLRYMVIIVAVEWRRLVAEYQLLFNVTYYRTTPMPMLFRSINAPETQLDICQE